MFFITINFDSVFIFHLAIGHDLRGEEEENVSRAFEWNLQILTRRRGRPRMTRCCSERAEAASWQKLG